MNAMDLIIISTVLVGAYLGFIRGVITQTVSFVGFIVIFIVSYLAKDLIAVYLCKWLPFIDINLYSIKSISVLNILLYELIAFFIIFGLLMMLFKYVMTYTEVFEAILKSTLVLALPLKILGLIVGVIEYILICLILIVVLSSPMINWYQAKDSYLANKIMNIAKLPFLPMDDLIKTTEDLEAIKKVNFKNHDQAELKILDIMLKNKMTTVSLVDELVAVKKLKVKNIETVLTKYRK